jgi:peptidoglycan-associated lipoprotein
MKTITLFLVLCAIGCSKDKPKTTPRAPESKPAPVTKKEPLQAPDVTADQMVSPTIGLSPDIAGACGIKQTTAAGSNPTFDYDKDELMAEDKAILDQVATCLTTGALKGRSVQLVGRADPRGTEEYNLGLGSRRANTVGQYLGRLGVPAPQRSETTRGSVEAQGTDEAGWKKDRRVDIVLAPQG